jgi:hypothetical protein
LAQARELAARVERGELHAASPAAAFRPAPDLSAWLVDASGHAAPTPLPPHLASLRDGPHRLGRPLRELHVVALPTAAGRLVVQYDAERNEAKVRDFGLYLIALGVLCLALAALLAWQVAGWIVAPIERLTARLANWAPQAPRAEAAASDEESRLLDAFAQVGASGATVGGRTVSIGEAATIATAKLALLAGPATLALAAAGLVLLARSRSSAADRLIWLAATIGAFVFVIVIARERGPSFVDRYALAATVLALPLATFAIAPALAELVRAAALVAAIAGSTIVATVLTPPELYLARRFPGEVVELARWLDDNRRPGETLLFTRGGWLPTYVPLLHRIGRDEYRIVSWYLSEPALRAFIARGRPTFLLTRDGDEAFVERVRSAGAEPGESLARFGRLEVRRLRLSTAEPRR